MTTKPKIHVALSHYPQNDIDSRWHAAVMVESPVGLKPTGIWAAGAEPARAVEAAALAARRVLDAATSLPKTYLTAEYLALEGPLQQLVAAAAPVPEVPIRGLTPAISGNVGIGTPGSLLYLNDNT